MKLFLACMTGSCVLAYSYLWYLGATVPAWQALIWVLFAFIHDLDEYLQSKM